MSKHKHRKGFREDQVMLSEAYSNIYDRRQQLDEIAPLVAAGLGSLAAGAMASGNEEDASDFAAGLENPSYGPPEVLQAIKNGQIKVVEVGGLDPREHEQPDAYITTAFIQTRDGDRELTDEEYEYINEPFSVNDRKQQNILSDFLHRAAEEEVINYRAGQEDAEDDEIGLDVKDPAEAYKDLENPKKGGMGSYL